MPSNVDKLVWLSMVPPAASELSRQISGTKPKSANALSAVGLVPPLARELVAQMTAGVGNLGRLANLGMVPPLAKEVAEQISGATPPSYPATYEPTFVNNTFIATPASMNTAWGKGPYWPQIIDLRSFSGCPASWMITFSTDHSPSGSGNSGLWAYYCFDSDPTTGTWLSYDQALAAGRFDSIVSKPSGNPIISQFDAVKNSAGFTQIETFWVNVIGSQLVASFSTSNVTGGRSAQGTPQFITSTDGVNWNLPATRAIFIDNPLVGGIIGNGATTYLKWGLNKYPNFINPATGLPWTYYGQCNSGDSVQVGNFMRLGSEDPLTSWTIIGGLTSSIDNVTYAPAEYNNRRAGTQTDWRSIMPIADNQYSRVSAFALPVSGDSAPNSVMSEQFVSQYGPQGDRFISQGIPILGISAERLNGAVFDSLVRDTVNNKWYATFVHRDAGDRNIVGLASGPLRNPAYTTRTQISPPVDPLSMNVRGDMSLTAPLPTGFSTSVRGSPVGLITLKNAGIELRVTSGAAGNSEASIFHDAGFIPTDYQMLDIWFGEVLEGNGTTAQRFLYAGFAGAVHTAMSAQTRALFISNTSALTSGGSATNAYMHRLDGGVDNALSVGANYYGLGLDTSGMPRAKRGFGVRLYPQAKRAFMLSEGMGALIEFQDLTAWDWTQRVYPFFTSRTALSSGSTNSFTTVRYINMGGVLV